MIVARFKAPSVQHAPLRVDNSPMRRTAAAVALACALLLQAAPAHAADNSDTEAAFVSKINALRVQKGLRPLVEHAELISVARAWAAKMAAVDRISHNPDLRYQVSADWVKLGENVGVGQTVDKLHAAFVASPTHYKNLVDPDFTHVGVGVVLGRDGAIFTTHQFMKLAGGGSAPPPPPRVSRPAPPPPPTEPPAPEPEPPVAAEPPAPPAPPARLVLVLEELRRLDRTGT